MQENTQNYKQSDLKFSSSKLYFQHQDQILQKLWFVSTVTVDIHFLYTFQEVHENYFIEWWEFEWLIVDHDVHEQGIIYKIWFMYPKFKNVNNLSLSLGKENGNKSVWPAIFSLLWWSVVFVILYFFAKKFVLGKVLFWLNLAWAFVLICFHTWEVLNFGYKNVWMDKKKSWNFSIKSSDESEASIVTPDIQDVLKKLSDEYWIIKAWFTWNCVYLLQDIHDRQWKKLKSTGKIYTEQEKAMLQQKTLDFIRQPEFLSHFMES